ncbi:snRNA-activating protein complex subunit 1-like [Corythoichthys intestinalis]|uniref:snRNA-activating protein complex subunit 1-like n=1 Tax=Corythoichthys intestinalis TaxID=161448 RepID=UPI0025A533EB|nr:snRNA-activating protein complex subunit 1-like [Corythoichthys intestinalis]XP_061793217.1 snRNA-activating protein complex subunit 1-like [Nerophis lumbriciformis]
MPRIPPTYADTFYEPLTEDVEALLCRFQNADSIRVECFTALWREARFQDVFLGIPSMSEMKKFCRVTMATAVKYFLPPYCYQIRVGGLYFMYAFYNTQLAVPPVRIRLTLQNWDNVQDFLRDSVLNGHLDVIYVYRKLVSARALEYTAMPHFLVFHRAKKAKGQKVCAGMLARATAVKELLSEDYLEEVANVQNHYYEMKNELIEVRLQANMTHADFDCRLKDSLNEFLTWQQKTFNQANITNENEDKPTVEEDCRSRAAMLASIKKRSYGQGTSKSRGPCQEVAAESSSSGRNKNGRPLSLRARTWNTLGKNNEKSDMQLGHLSGHDQKQVSLQQKKRLQCYKQ